MKNRNLARVLALVLVLCMGVMMLSACGRDRRALRGSCRVCGTDRSAC